MAPFSYLNGYTWSLLLCCSAFSYPWLRHTLHEKMFFAGIKSKYVEQVTFDILLNDSI